MLHTTAMATLIHHRTKATVPHLLLQSRTTVKAVIWIILVKVMQIDEREAVSFISVLRAVMTCLGYMTMRAP